MQTYIEVQGRRFGNHLATSTRHISKSVATMSTILKNIAMIGASGSVGKPTLEELLKIDTHNITVISRSCSQAVFPPGVEVRKGDYDDDAFMQSALSGQEVLIIMLAFPALPQQDRIFEQAAKAGVKYVLPSEYGYGSSVVAIVYGWLGLTSRQHG